jgi:hypothetical protein
LVGYLHLSIASDEVDDASLFDFMINLPLLAQALASFPHFFHLVELHSID